MVHPGHAYTVAGVGPNKALRLQVLDDRLNTPKGRSLVRVIQASLKEHHVTVKAGRATLAYNLPFGSITTYGTDSPGTWTVHAKGGTETWSGQVKLTAGTIHTLVVLDSSSGLEVTRPDGRRGQLRDAERRRGDRARRHGPGARLHATALGGRGDRGRAAHPGRRVPLPPGQGARPGTPVEGGGPSRTREPGQAGARAAGVPGRARGSSRLVTSPRTSPASGPRQGGPPGRACAGGSLWPWWPAGWPCWSSAWPWSRWPPRAGRRPGGTALSPGAVRTGRPGPGPGRGRPGAGVPDYPGHRRAHQADQAGHHRTGHPAGTRVRHGGGLVCREPAAGRGRVIRHRRAHRLLPRPYVFYRLGRMRPGERIYVRRADSSLAVFSVYAVWEYPKDRFPTGRVYGPAPDAELHIITCGGTFDHTTRSYLSNVVVYSTQVR